MPTPFMHLEMAEAIRTAVSQQDDKNGRLLHQQLLENWSAFYFGQIAPDFSFLANIKREDTHFYPIPLTKEHDPISKMLQTYPELKPAHTLPPAQRWFIAGYLAHLLYDQFWFLEIITPYFWQNNVIGKPTHRRLAHLLLLCAMDAESLAQLPANAGDDLDHAKPDQWIPFGSNEALIAWQTMIASQLQPSAQIRTLEIFAPRAELDVITFSGYFHNKSWMAEHVYAVVPVEATTTLKQKTCLASIELLKKYLDN